MTSLSLSAESPEIVQNLSGAVLSECYVHELVERSARLTPNAVAIEQKEQRLTYGELDRRASQLAQKLHECGLTIGAPVALLLGRSIEMAVALLGVLKAGGVYLPLDPAYPDERLKFMVEDSAAALIVSDGRLESRLPLLKSRARLLRIDTELGGLSQMSPAPAAALAPHDLAYILYTSGSTGLPKGVEMPHGALGNLIRWQLREPRLGQPARTVQWSALGFDVSLQEIFSTWASGGTLVLITEELRQNPAAMWQFLCAQAIERLFVPFIALQALAEIAADPHSPKSALRDIVSAGERLQISPSLLRMMERLPGCQLHNHYGPTESHVVTAHTLVGPPAKWPLLPPIGRPISNVEIHILDEGRRPVAVGEIGEIYIGGVCLARGYRGRPALTAERFIVDPFCEGGAARLYRTGDLARQRPDGEIEILGRNDDQVKIRGFRVELGEIEAVLRSHAAVREAVVVAPDEPGSPSRRLIAYLIADPERAVDNENLRPSTEAEQVADWRSVYEQTYRTRASADPFFDTRGWNSSYTGKPIPEQEMREWVDATAARILAEKPRRVLELGCGSGLLLWRIAPQTSEYWGTDLSGSAIELLRKLLQRGTALSLPPIELREQPADQFDGIPSSHFDVVVLNSVVHHFPSIHYLLRVIVGALRVVRPGGKIFIGDVQDLRLLRAFHASVQLGRASAQLSTAALVQTIDRRVAFEQQLMIDPALFATLPEHILGLVSAQVWLRRGRARNEMNAFRYDVLLTSQAAPADASLDASTASQHGPLDDGGYVDWQANGLTLDWLAARLAEQPRRLLLARIPNQRTAAAVIAERLLREPIKQPSAEELRRAIAAAQEDSRAIDPEDIWSAAAVAGYTADVTYSPAPDLGSFDVVLTSGGAVLPPPAPRPDSVPAGLWQSLANQPLNLRPRDQLRSLLKASLRSFLKDRLPEYMVPSSFVLLDELPLLPSGKVDRRSLPAPDVLRPDLMTPYVAPHTHVEKQLAEIFAEVLKLDRVGIHDDYFALGGHSLLITRVATLVHKQLHKRIPLKEFLQRKTIAELTEFFELPATSAPVELAPAPRDRPLPLAFMQQRLYFLEKLGIMGHAYHFPFNLQLRGPLDLAALRRALTEIVRRHEALRTLLREIDGDVSQVILPPAEFELTVDDLRNLAPSLREQVSRTAAQSEFERPFAFDRELPFRVKLQSLSEDEHVLRLTIHHIAYDGWSGEILVRELRALYTAFASGEPSPLPELAVQFADFAAWQQAYVQGDVLREQIEYWKRKLAGLIPAELIPDRPRTRKGSIRSPSAPLHFVGDEQLTLDLQQLGRRHGTTMSMTLLAVFKLLLARYAGQADIAVGMPVSNRDRAEFEGFIGCCINTLVMRTDLSDDPSFVGLLARVRETTLEALAHRDVSFDRIVAELSPVRDLERNPLYQIMFAFQEHWTSGLHFQLHDIDAHSLDIPASTFGLDLMFHTWIEAGRIHWLCMYDAELFDRGTMEQFAACYRALLGAVAADPERPISQLTMLPQEERELLLATTNPTQLLAGDSCIHELFFAQAEHSADATAVVVGGQALSYGELARRVHALALSLVAAGVEAEVRVGLYIDRSIEMLIGMLGILAAGGAYVPLDPSFPEERLRAMAADAGIALFVTSQRLCELPAALRRIAPVLRVEDANGVAALPTHRISRARVENLAYVLFTSGSTGRPQGVLVEHRNVVSFFRAMDERLGVTGRRVWLAITTFTFDISILELLWTLCRGFKVVLTSAAELTERAAGHGLPSARCSVDHVELGLSSQIQREGVTHLQCTPSLFKLLAAEPAAHATLDRLDALLLGGETLPLAEGHRAAELVRGTVYNMYGPTETTIWSTSGVVARGCESISIGRPLANTRVYVLDRHGNHMPLGAAGELHIGGHGVARGYLNQPELTAQRFIVDRFSGETDARLYRTGDLVRWRSGGELEFLGRRDEQVKVRGYRVELAEIEWALRQHPDVVDAVVVFTEVPPVDKQLVAYVVLDPQRALREHDLRKHLGRCLPAYMVPTQLVQIDALPLLPSGKVDRKALRPPADPRARPPGTRVGPRSDFEAALLTIWRDLLKRDEVGVEDNFFDLGGYSLIGIRLTVHIRQSLAIDMPLHKVFELQTIARMAEWLGAQPRPSPAPVALATAEPAIEEGSL